MAILNGFMLDIAQGPLRDTAAAQACRPLTPSLTRLLYRVRQLLIHRLTMKQRSLRRIQLSRSLRIVNVSISLKYPNQPRKNVPSSSMTRASGTPQDRLLDKSIHDRGYAEVSGSTAGFGNRDLPDRLGTVIPSQQLLPNPWPLLTQIACQIINGHPVYAWAAFVRSDPFQRPDQVLSVDNLIHQISHHGFGPLRCRRRLMRLTVIPAGFTLRA